MSGLRHSSANRKPISVLWLFVFRQECRKRVRAGEGSKGERAEAGIGFIDFDAVNIRQVRFAKQSLPVFHPLRKRKIKLKSDQGLVAVAVCLRSTQPCSFHHKLTYFAWQHALPMASRLRCRRLLQSTGRSSIGDRSMSRSSALAILRLCPWIHQQPL